MNSIQQFKTRTGTSFPTCGEVLRIAAGLGYRKSYLVDDEDPTDEEEPSLEVEPCLPLLRDRPSKRGEATRWLGPPLGFARTSRVIASRSASRKDPRSAGPRRSGPDGSGGRRRRAVRPGRRSRGLGETASAGASAAASKQTNSGPGSVAARIGSASPLRWSATESGVKIGSGRSARIAARSAANVEAIPSTTTSKARSAVEAPASAVAVGPMPSSARSQSVAPRKAARPRPGARRARPSGLPPIRDQPWSSSTVPGRSATRAPCPPPDSPAGSAKPSTAPPKSRHESIEIASTLKRIDEVGLGL